jgi:hypothetical protein
MPYDRKEALDEFSKLFNLVDEDSDDEYKDDESTEEYADSTLSNESFEKAIEGINEVLSVTENGKELESKEEQSGKDVEESQKEFVNLIEDEHSTIKKMCSDAKSIKSDSNKDEQEEKLVREDNDENKNDDKDMFEAFDCISEYDEGTKDNLEEDLEKEYEKNNDEIVENNKSKDNISYEGHESGKVKMIDGIVEWNLNSPAPIYNGFYERKRELVEIYTPVQLNFNKMDKELREATVDISGNIFDKKIVLCQMEEVQGHRERLKTISMDCTNQYFLWKRWVEMLRGYLARIEYLKPALKQDGLVMEHMRDVELYFTKLDSLYDNCKKVDRTLEAAYDTLSRKVTICMDLKSPERYGQPLYNIEENQTEYSGTSYKRASQSKMQEFDSAPKGVTASKKEKIGILDWSDF